MDKTAELLDRIAALELRVAQLEARPQAVQTIGGAGGWSWPWGTVTPSITPIASVYGDNTPPETPKGMNGAGGPNDGQK